MKLKRSLLVVLIVSILTAAFPICAYSAGADDYIPEKVMFAFYDGAKVGIYDKTPEIIESAVYTENEKMMLPAKYIFSNLGYEIKEDDTSFSATGKNTVVLTNNSNEITVDGEKISLSVNTTKKDKAWLVSEEIFAKLGYVSSKNNGVLVVSDDNKTVDFKPEELKPIFGIYVSPYTNKSVGGTPQSPIAFSALLGKTEDAVKKLGSVFPTFVFLMGGEYKHYKTLDFSSATFSSDSHKMIYIEAYGDSQPVISGSVDLDINELKPVTDAATLARIPKAGRGNVAYMDLKKYNIAYQADSGSFYHYIYLDGMKQPLSRWPNKDFAKVKSVPQAKTFGFSEIEPTTWTKAKHGRIYGFFQYDYDLLNAEITSVDPINKLINGPNFKTTRAGARYYAVNMLEVIDMPGEWYVDVDEQILYYYPPYSLKESKLEIATAPFDAITLGSAKNISFKGIEFTKFGGRAINAVGPQNLEVRECNFNHLQGGNAITTTSSSYNCVFDSNTAYNLEGSFIKFNSGNLKTGKNGNCVVSNNHLINTNRAPSQNRAVIGSGWPSYERSGSLGLDIYNNVIQDSSGMGALNPNGEDVKIYYNEIMNQSRDIDDGGAIYAGKSYTFQGFEVMHNYVHDLNKDHSYCAYYNDDGYAGGKWMYNVSKDVNKQSITGLGADFNMSFNLAINNKQGVALGSRMTWTATIFGDDGELYKEVKKVIESEYGAEYLKIYPHVAEYLERKPFSAPYNAIAWGNVGVNIENQKPIQSYPTDEYKYFATEFTYDGKTVDIKDKNAKAEGNPHFSYKDDYFVDPENQNFNIKPDSEISKAVPELLKIDMTKIGIEEDKIDDVMIVPEDGFRLRSPMNGESSVQTKATLFSWDQVRGASKYRVMIATDKDMKNLVYDNTIWENNASNFEIVDSLTLDTIYYWQVEAIGISRQKPFTVKSVGPFAFKTAKKNELSKDGLKLALESGTKFVEGLDSGEYKYDETFLNEFKSLIEKANTAYKSSSVQEEIDALEEEIYLMVGKSPYFQYLHYDHLDVFRPEQEWTHNKETSGRTVNDDGSVIFHAASGTDSKAYVNTKNSVLCFKVKFDAIPTSGYRGIYFKYNSKGKGYLIVIKPDILEFQGIDQTLFTMPNFEVKAGEWCEMEVGGINTPGGVLQFWKINGKTVFARLDTTGGQTRDEGRIWVRHTGPNTHFMKVDKLPEDQTIYDAILKEFNAPESEGHLEWLLSGSSDALEINSTFYNVSDKNELARVLYPSVANKQIQISENGDITAYRNAVTEALILTGYNTGLEDYIFQNRVHTYFNDIIKFEKIDENGRNLYSFYKNKLKDVDRIEIHTNSMNKKYNTMEDLRKEFARQILRISINSCSRSFANENSYYKTILTKENADYIGIDIDKYLALNDDGKDAVNAIIHASAKNDRTLEEIVQSINDAASAQ